MNPNAIQIHPDDNVAVAVMEIKAGSEVAVAGPAALATVTDVPRNHKVALRDIPEGGPVVKYGETIGLAKQDISAGEWVHTHNMISEGG